jgi:hypothetical protein
MDPEFVALYLSYIEMFLVCLKNPAFEAEKEWRLICTYRPLDPTKMIFRQRQSVMSRHLPLRLEGKLPITGITVGPCRYPTLSRIAVNDLLQAYGKAKAVTDLSSDASRGGFGNAATKREEDLPPCFRGNGLNRRSLPAPLVASYKQSSNQGSHRIAQSDLQPHRDRFDQALSRDPFRGAFGNVENVRVTPEPGEFKAFFGYPAKLAPLKFTNRSDP